ncbi:MAG: MFS transporter [Anaerolineae bacterium]|nr:MFS transporter [Anaerolineae bacterium]
MTMRPRNVAQITVIFAGGAAASLYIADWGQAVRTLWRDVGHDTRWVMWSYALWGIGEGLWLFILPLYAKSLGATPDQAGFIIGLWGLGRLLFILPAGILADRFGARRLMLPSWYLSLTGVAIMALAPNWRWAAPGLLIYGFSAAATSITNLYITQAARYDSTRSAALPLQTVLTLIWAAYSLGLVVTPAIGGWIGEQFSLRAVYIISTFWFVLSTLAIMRTHPYPTPEPPPGGYDYGGLLRRRSVTVPLIVLTLGFIALLTGQALSSQYLEEARGFSRGVIGVFGSLSALGTAIFSLLLGRLTSWRGFFSSLLLVLVSFVLLMSTGNTAVVMGAAFLLGAHYAARPLAASVIGERVPAHQHGIAYALVDAVAGLATLIGTNIAGRLYGANPDWPFAAGSVGLVLVMALGVMLRLRGTTRALRPRILRVGR